MEVVGVAVIVGGALVSLGAAYATWRTEGREPSYRSYRQALGRGILLGLEFLVAADIIRTVSHVPTVRQVSVLGGIVLIRTFLSFTLEVELDGRWPWQRPRPPRASPHGSNTRSRDAEGTEKARVH